MATGKVKLTRSRLPKIESDEFNLPLVVAIKDALLEVLRAARFVQVAEDPCLPGDAVNG